MKKVFIFPNLNADQNFYINNLYNTIKNNYEVYGMLEMKKKGLKSLLSGDIYHFNWFENFSSSSFLNTYSQYIKRKILIKVLKLRRKKIVWTVHNILPHNSKYSKISKKFLKFMAKNADRIHVLCDETKNIDYLKKYSKKIKHICHGDYFDNYPKSKLDVKKRYGISKDKKVILFLGQIRKYKNIEVLIEGFNQSKLNNKNTVLLICGMCNDEEYKKELVSKNYNNIIFDFKFVKDEEISSYLNNCSIVVAPYDKTSSLNSGSLWMTMSYKKTMVLPLIGCIKDFEYNKYLYVYDYKNKEEHANKLAECLDKVYKDMDKLDEKGKKCYEYMNNYASWKKNQEAWIDLYKF